MKWKLFITLPWVAWYLKTEEAENILSEWNKMMKISILCKSFSSGGKKIKASLTSSENICPPTSFSFKGPIDLTYTVVFNSFDLLGSPPVHPVFSTQTEAELKSSQPRKAGGWGDDPSIMPTHLFQQRNDEAWDPNLERWM